ncbi:hypothetical protein CTI12_AA148750 [Artemisia annua]|uniref:Uncharacterized protein n=1 Tax=Artemisia annua TaxID=35608 RepID=A0A2U1MWI8_ARTAN|nr:hypothetical protein CTI12_AA148750 [Artemisia annua]
MERKNTKVNSEKASVPKGRVEQRVKLINSNATMEEKLRQRDGSYEKLKVQRKKKHTILTILGSQHASSPRKSTNEKLSHVRRTCQKEYLAVSDYVAEFYWIIHLIRALDSVSRSS